MKIVKEFREFIIRGKVIELAIGIIIGSAFGKIVTSAVEDVITPLLLKPALKAVGADNIAALTWNGIKYGNFLSAVIDFLSIATVLFVIVKIVNKLKKEEPLSSEESLTTILLMEIRDAIIVSQKK